MPTFLLALGLFNVKTKKRLKFVACVTAVKASSYNVMDVCVEETHRDIKYRENLIDCITFHEISVSIEIARPLHVN
jgi:hypothetical protein